MNSSYAECAEGLILPILNETEWSPLARAVLYFAGLLYCFLGVAIIADIFMCSIEKITSKTRKITLSAQQKVVRVYEDGHSEPGSDLVLVAGAEPDVIEVKVWNETVANLTLMALGSSAPEILLSVIEIVGNGFRAGDLGPGTIVGSAAFNLLVICGVCVAAIPAEETRRIRMIKVFAVTASFSVFAYVWLLIILVLVSPDVVELWESILTLLFFFILVLLAYLADKGILLPGRKKEDITDQKQIELKSTNDPEKAKDAAPNGTDSHKKKFFQNGRIDRSGLLDFIKDIRKHPGLTDEDCATLAAARLADEQAHSRGWYRVSAIRDFTGGKRTKLSISAQLQHKLDTQVQELFAVADTLDKNDDKPEADRNRVATPDVPTNCYKGTLLTPLPRFIDKGFSYIEFNASQVAVLEKSKKATVLLRRRGNTQAEAAVRVETIDAHLIVSALPFQVILLAQVQLEILTVKSGYVTGCRVVETSGTATAHDDYRPLRQVVKFASGEVVKAITVEIVDDQQWEPDESFFVRLSIPLAQKSVRLGRKSVMEVVIINDDEPGQFQFLRRGVLVKESVGVASLTVIRQKGCDGVAHVHWRTKNQTAVHGKDYVG
ncbi:sodium/calcium exchanger 1-like, partial [Tropilaelaps mercedesae]